MKTKKYETMKTKMRKKGMIALCLACLTFPFSHAQSNVIYVNDQFKAKKTFSLLLSTGDKEVKEKTVLKVTEKEIVGRKPKYSLITFVLTDEEKKETEMKATEFELNFHIYTGELVKM